jgi:hypothetical protein
LRLTVLIHQQHKIVWIQSCRGLGDSQVHGGSKTEILGVFDQESIGSPSHNVPNTIQFLRVRSIVHNERNRITGKPIQLFFQLAQIRMKRHGHDRQARIGMLCG